MGGFVSTPEETTVEHMETESKLELMDMTCIKRVENKSFNPMCSCIVGDIIYITSYGSKSIYTFNVVTRNLNEFIVLDGNPFGITFIQNKLYISLDMHWMNLNIIIKLGLMYKKWKN